MEYLKESAKAQEKDQEILDNLVKDHTPLINHLANVLHRNNLMFHVMYFDIPKEAFTKRKSDSHNLRIHISLT